MNLFITDLDGTIVKDEDDVTRTDLDAIKKLRENGFLIVTATGRPSKGVKFLKDLYGLELDYYILANGSLIKDENFNILYKKTIE